MISVADMEAIAGRVKLRLTKNEKEYFAKALNDMLAWLDQVEEAEVEEEAAIQMLSTLKNAFREDAVQLSIDHQKVFQNVSDAKGGYFRVPSVLE